MQVVANLEASAFNNQTVQHSASPVRVRAAFKRHEPKSLNYSPNSTSETRMRLHVSKYL